MAHTRVSTFDTSHIRRSKQCDTLVRSEIVVYQSVTHHLYCRFHSGAGRYIKPGQKLHSSVIHGAQQKNGSYEPKALLEKFEGGDIGIKSWSKLSGIKMKNLPNYVERDLYDRALELVSDISSAEDHSRKRNNIMELVKQFVSMILYFSDLLFVPCPPTPPNRTLLGGLSPLLPPQTNS